MIDGLTSVENRRAFDLEYHKVLENESAGRDAVGADYDRH